VHWVLYAMHHYLYAIYIFGAERVIILVMALWNGREMRRAENPMSSMQMGADETPQPNPAGAAKLPASQISVGMRVAGAILRVVFVVCLFVLTLRVCLPQNETIWTVYDTPGDLVRLLLGAAVCVWIVVQLFKPPHDTQGYRTWLYFGIAAVPFALLCVYVFW